MLASPHLLFQVGTRRGGEKQKKQLAELEAQLVLASPHLLFQVGTRRV